VKIIETELPGVVVIEPRVFGDDRGYFLETWSRSKYVALGLPGEFVQDNVSLSGPRVIRGLHYQHPSAQGKLVMALRGEVFDVAVDIRRGSPTFGRWTGVLLSDSTLRQMYVPPGFAHGFAVVGDAALVSYKCTSAYNAQHESSIRWDDPEIGIEWPVANPIVSAKDRDASRLHEMPIDRLPGYEEAPL
jgi:dTDP-4-dehydrorhamnose 3,5-epimerase